MRVENQEIWASFSGTEVLVRSVRLAHKQTGVVSSALQIEYPYRTVYMLDKDSSEWQRVKETKTLDVRQTEVHDLPSIGWRFLDYDTPEITLTPNGKVYLSPNAFLSGADDAQALATLLTAVDNLDESLRKPDNPWSCPMCGLNWDDGGGVEGRNMHFASCPLKPLFDARNKLPKCD